MLLSYNLLHYPVTSPSHPRKSPCTQPSTQLPYALDQMFGELQHQRLLPVRTQRCCLTLLPAVCASIAQRPYPHVPTRHNTAAGHPFPLLAAVAVATASTHASPSSPSPLPAHGLPNSPAPEPAWLLPRLRRRPRMRASITVFCGGTQQQQNQQQHEVSVIAHYVLPICYVQGACASEHDGFPRGGVGGEWHSCAVTGTCDAW